jgi:hypothetical protein
LAGKFPADFGEEVLAAFGTHAVFAKLTRSDGGLADGHPADGHPAGGLMTGLAFPAVGAFIALVAPVMAVNCISICNLTRIA